VFTFGAKKKAIESAVLPHGVNAVESPGKHLVDVTLMADVEDELVLRSIKDPVERDRQFNHAKVRSKMAASLGKDSYQFVTHFLRELGQAFLRQSFDICGGMDSVEQAPGGRSGGCLRRD
jgi:hypothetical protein